MRPMSVIALVVSLVSPAALAKAPSCPSERFVRAATFAAQARSWTQAERYGAYLEACGLEDAIELAQRLIAFPTVSSDAAAGDSAPIAQMGEYLKDFARQHDMAFRSIANDAVFELSVGEGPPVLGFVLHGDVVPASADGWKHPPFVGTVENGRLYGRGSEDDKGPIAAVLSAMVYANELGLPLTGRVLAIIGNGEESSWDGMKAYAAAEPKPAHVISIDSAYPVVTAQSGFVAWSLDAPLGEPVAEKGALAFIADASAGEFLTQVPGMASMTLRPVGAGSAAVLLAKTRAAIGRLGGSRSKLSVVVEQRGDELVVTARGNAVHSSEADKGHNALWDLSAVAQALPLASNGLSALLAVVERYFDRDHFGRKLGLAHADPIMGRLLVAPTLLKRKGDKAVMMVNMRRPRGMDSAAFRQKLKEASARVTEQAQGRVVESDESEQYVGEPFVADASGPLVSTLLDLYRRRTKDVSAKPLSIRGGTYARLFPGAVDFGPSLPGAPYAGHGHDEYLDLAALRLTTLLVGDALFALAIAGI